MKKQIQSFLLFVGLCVSGMAYGQTGTLKLDSLKWKSATYSPYTIKGIKLSEPSYTFTAKHPYPIIRISDLKPDSSYHIWIDKKAIKWTSDSTFILKRKP